MKYFSAQHKSTHGSHASQLILWSCIRPISLSSSSHPWMLLFALSFFDSSHTIGTEPKATDSESGTPNLNLALAHEMHPFLTLKNILAEERDRCNYQGPSPFSRSISNHIEVATTLHLGVYSSVGRALGFFNLMVAGSSPAIPTKSQRGELEWKKTRL